MNPAIENKKYILAKLDNLTPEQQQQVLIFINSISLQSEQNDIQHKQSRKWQEIRGKAPYPLVGEDAQTWISRNRTKESENRELNLRNSYEV